MCLRVVTSCRSRQAVPGGAKRGRNQTPTRSGAPSSNGESRSEEHRDPHGAGESLAPKVKAPRGPWRRKAFRVGRGRRAITGSGGRDRPRSRRTREGFGSPSGSVTERQRLGRTGRTRKKTPRIANTPVPARRSGVANRDQWSSHRGAGGSSSQATSGSCTRRGCSVLKTEDVGCNTSVRRVSGLPAMGSARTLVTGDPSQGQGLRSR